MGNPAPTKTKTDVKQRDIGLFPVFDYPDIITQTNPLTSEAIELMRPFHETLLEFCGRNEIKLQKAFFAGEGTSTEEGLKNFTAYFGGHRIKVRDLVNTDKLKEIGYRRQCWDMLTRIRTQGKLNSFTYENLSFALPITPIIESTETTSYDLRETEATKVTQHPATDGKIYEKREHHMKYQVQLWHEKDAANDVGYVPKHKLPLRAKVYEVETKGGYTKKVDIIKKIKSMGGDHYEAMELLQDPKTDPTDLDKLVKDSITQAAKKFKSDHGKDYEKTVKELARRYPLLTEDQIRDAIRRLYNKDGNKVRDLDSLERGLAIAQGRLKPVWLWNIHTLEVTEYMGTIVLSEKLGYSYPAHISQLKVEETVIQKTYLITDAGKIPESLLSKIDEKINIMQLINTLRPLLEDAMSAKDIEIITHKLLHRNLQKTAEYFKLQPSVISQKWEMALVNISMKVKSGLKHETTGSISVVPIQGSDEERIKNLDKRLSTNEDNATSAKSSSSESGKQPRQSKPVSFEDIIILRTGSERDGASDNTSTQ